MIFSTYVTQFCFLTLENYVQYAQWAEEQQPLSTIQIVNGIKCNEESFFPGIRKKIKPWTSTMLQHFYSVLFCIFCILEWAYSTILVLGIFFLLIPFQNSYSTCSLKDVFHRSLRQGVAILRFPVLVQYPSLSVFFLFLWPKKLFRLRCKKPAVNRCGIFCLPHLLCV